MTTKVITGTYPAGYYLNPAYDTLAIATTADVEGTGVTTSSAQPSTIFNDGKVNGSTNGISLADGGAVMNHAGASVNGNTAILAQSGYTKVVNGGTITSNTVRTYPDPNHSNFYTDYNGPSVVLQAGGKVSQTSTDASIGNGIRISGAPGEVVNRGTINGPKTLAYRSYPETSYGYSIELAAGGSVNNGANDATSARIKSGIKISGALGAVTNNGIIQGANDVYDSQYNSSGTDAPSIVLTAGGTVVNGTGGNTTALIEDGLVISGARGTVTNIGRIGSPGSSFDFDGGFSYQDKAAVRMMDGGSVSNASSGTINGISISGAAGTVENSGTLIGAGYSYQYFFNTKRTSRDFAVDLAAGGRVTNSVTGAIAGVSISGGTGAVMNDGSITGPAAYDSKYYGNTTGYSIVFTRGGTVVNGSASSTSASLANGVSISGGKGRITNDGTIAGPQLNDYQGMALPSFSVVLAAGGTIVNGSASNAAASLISGLSASGGTTKVTNFGTIGANSDGVALIFDRSSDTLIEEGSGALGGTVTGTDSKFVLAGDAGAGSIGGFGSTITGFRSIDVAAGSDWTFTGTNEIQGGVTLSDEGTLHVARRLTISGTFDVQGAVDLGSAGQLVNQANARIMLSGAASIGGSGSDTKITNSGLIAKNSASGMATLTAGLLLNEGEIDVRSGTLDISGPVSAHSVGRLQIGAKATLELGAAVHRQTVVFQKPSGTLRLDDSDEFDGTLSRFRTGNKIDLTDFARQGSQLSYTQNADHTEGTLTVTNGDQVATLTFEGAYRGTSFRLRNDGHGGSNLVYLAPAGQSSAPTNGDPAFTQSLFAAAFGGSTVETHTPMTHQVDSTVTLVASPDHPGAMAMT